MDDDPGLQCVHCKNPVVLINYVGQEAKMRGELYNKYKHGHPRPYPPCNTSPLMDEDVEALEEAT